MVESPSDLIDTMADHGPPMSRAEAQARCLAAMAAQAFSEEQLRLVAAAKIVEGDSAAELRSSLAQLHPADVARLVETMAKNPQLLDEQSLAGLASILGPPQRETKQLDVPA